MALTIGVRFRENGKVYDFAAGDLRPQVGDMVVVETARGTECATVVTPCRETPENKTAQPLKPVLRAATQADMRRFEEMRAKERHAMEICQKKIAEHKLEMKLVDAEYAADNAKILFYFTADGQNYHCDIGNLDPNASYRVTISYDSSRYYLYGLMKVEGIG